jgi:outer membrane immunogenic protein
MKNTSKAGALVTGAIFALFAGSAMAADMKAPPMLMKAPPPAPVYSWTGCYLGGGLGYGMWNQDNTFLDVGIPASATETAGGRGWFGTASVGCDYQVSSSWVIGAFADGDWGSLKGTLGAFPFGVGDEKMTSAWYVGARIGYLVTPQLLTYWGGGYTQARFSDVTLFDFDGDGTPTGLALVAQTYHGWFLSGGVEYALPMFSGLFWRNDYRVATYNSETVSLTEGGVLIPTSSLAFSSQKWVQTARTELIYRFNWGH